MSVVLLCDDELLNRKVASKILNKEGFSVIEACDGAEAIAILEHSQIDLILMDLMMPVMDGYEAIKIIKSRNELSTIPLIIISALSDKDAIMRGLELGADEYLTKPFDILEFRLRVKNAIKIGSYQNMLKDKKILLESEVALKTKELQDALREIQKSERDIVSILGKTAEYRDNETGGHIKRTRNYIKLLAKKLQNHDKFKAYLSDEVIEMLYNSAPLQKSNNKNSTFVFTSNIYSNKPINKESPNCALRVMGFNDISNKRKISLHGFRGTFRSLADTYQIQHNATFEAKEGVLDHHGASKIVKAYNHEADYFEQLKSPLKWWSSFLQKL